MGSSPTADTVYEIHTLCSKGVEMYISSGDVVAVSIALFASLFALVIAFRRVYVLEGQNVQLRRQLRGSK